MFTFEDGRTLLLRADTEKDSSDHKYAYLTATKHESIFGGKNSNYVLAFDQDDNAKYGIKEKTSYYLQRNEPYGYVRLIHYLQ